MASTRNTDPKVVHLRGKLGVAVLRGDQEAEKACRQELHKAKILADARRAAARLHEVRGDLTPEELAEVSALLGGA